MRACLPTLLDANLFLLSGVTGAALRALPSRVPANMERLWPFNSAVDRACIYLSP